MPRESFFIYDRNVRLTHILAIMPYQQPFDPANHIYEDLNSSVLLTGRPHRLPAKRDSETLALQFGFFYLPLDRIALNPKCRIVAEPFTPEDEMSLRRYPNAATRLTLDRSGFKRTLMVNTDPATVVSILSAPPLCCPLLDIAQSEREPRNPKLSAG